MYVVFASSDRRTEKLSRSTVSFLEFFFEKFSLGNDITFVYRIGTVVRVSNRLELHVVVDEKVGYTRGVVVVRFRMFWTRRV